MYYNNRIASATARRVNNRPILLFSIAVYIRRASVDVLHFRNNHPKLITYLLWEKARVVVVLVLVLVGAILILAIQIRWNCSLYLSHLILVIVLRCWSKKSLSVSRLYVLAIAWCFRFQMVVIYFDYLRNIVGCC